MLYCGWFLNHQFLFGIILVIISSYITVYDIFRGILIDQSRNFVFSKFVHFCNLNQMIKFLHNLLLSSVKRLVQKVQSNLLV